MAGLDDEIDALYRLPLNEFTAARTQLARTAGGADAAAVKALKKPTTIPWAINQLYWNDRRTYQRLLDSGRALRDAQIAALQGRKADVRDASEKHRAAVAEAAAKAVRLAAAAGVKTTTEALARMLDAVSLAREEPRAPGRFTEPLQPQAFDALAGVTPRSPREPDGGAHHAAAQADREASHHPRKDTPAQRRAREAESKRREQEARQERHALEAAVARTEHANTRAQDMLNAARERFERAEREARVAQEALDAARTELDAFDKG